MSELSAGWERPTFGELVRNRDNERIPVNATERSKRLGEIPYYGATGQAGWIDSALFNEELLLVGEDGVQFFDAHKQKSYMITGPSWVNNHAHVLSELPNGPPLAYLMHYLNWVDYRGYANGTTRLKLTRTALDSIPVALPPLAEQFRIVEAIEAAFSVLDAGVAYLEAARGRLRVLVSAILASATERSSHVELGRFSAEVRNGLFVSRPSATPPGVPILRIGSVRPLKLDLTDHGFANVDPSDPRVSRALLEPGDLLFTRYNGNPEYVGACAVVPATIGVMLHPDKLIRVRVDRSQAVPEFVEMAVAVGEARRFIESATKTTAGQAGISGSDLRKVPVPLPDVDSQRLIVAAVEVEIASIDAALQSAFAQLRRASTLRRSILSTAFSGKLVPQDPNDEPARVLLERIAAARAASEPTPKRRRARTKVPA